MAIPKRAYMLQTIETENGMSCYTERLPPCQKFRSDGFSYTMNTILITMRLEQWNIAHRSR